MSCQSTKSDTTLFVDSEHVVYITDTLVAGCDQQNWVRSLNEEQPQTRLENKLLIPLQGVRTSSKAWKEWPALLKAPSQHRRLKLMISNVPGQMGSKSTAICVAQHAEPRHAQ